MPKPHHKLPSKGAYIKAHTSYRAVAYSQGGGIEDGTVGVDTGDWGIVESLGVWAKGAPGIARVRVLRTGKLIGVSPSSYRTRWSEIEG
jgi:hypothetical protein